jgi:HlyD family secretion protein
MKKFKWAILAILILLVIAGIWYWKFRKPDEIILLDTQKVQYGSVTNSVTATGTLQPVDTVAVGSQISGIIKNVYVDFNSPVKKGQLLAKLDKSLMDAQVQQYSAALQNARANVIYQKSNYERQDKLFKLGAISKAEFETATYLYKAANENVNSILAQLKTANKNLSFTDIYSPIDGTILSRSISEGQTVAASLNTPTLFSIAKDLTKMQVQASVDEADIGDVKKGQRAIFSVDAFPADTFSGTVKDIRLRSSVSANVVTYITIIDAPNVDMKLKPGMTANITIYTKEVNNILYIPTGALNFKPDSILKEKFHLADSLIQPIRSKRKSVGKSLIVNLDSLGNKISKGMVWIKKDSVTIFSKWILFGLDDKTVVQVISGLKEGDEVITGYKKLLEKDAGAAKVAKSPFVPARGVGGNRPH